MPIDISASSSRLRVTTNIPASASNLSGCAWCRWTGTDYAPLLCIDDTGAGYFYWGKFNNPNQLMDVNGTSITGAARSLNTWYWLGFTYNGSTGATRLFVDGVLDTSGTTGTSWATGAMSIGQGLRWADDEIGQTFGFKLWSATLSDAEIIAEYYKLWPNRLANLISFVPMIHSGAGQRNFDWVRGEAWTENGVADYAMPTGTIVPATGVPPVQIGVPSAGGTTVSLGRPSFDITPLSVTPTGAALVSLGRPNLDITPLEVSAYASVIANLGRLELDITPLSLASVTGAALVQAGRPSIRISPQPLTIQAGAVIQIGRQSLDITPRSLTIGVATTVELGRVNLEVTPLAVTPTGDLVVQLGRQALDLTLLPMTMVSDLAVLGRPSFNITPRPMRIVETKRKPSWMYKDRYGHFHPVF